MTIPNRFLSFLVSCAVVLAFSSCSSSGGDDAEAVGPSAQKAATPTFSPNGGHFENSVGVTISCGTDGAEIRYTKDGSVPTSSSALYAGPITLDDGCTLKAVATKSGLADSDPASSSAYFVKKWRFVGSAGISGGDSAHLSIALNGNDVPYVAFADGGDGYKAHVKKWDGSTWASADGSSIATDTAFTSLAISPSGGVYAAYQDGAYSGYAVASRLSGGTWTVLGSWDVSGNPADFIAAAVDSSERLYVAFRDQSTLKASVKRYSSGWNYLGSAGMTTGDAQYLSLAVDSSSVPYLAFRDGASSGKATVLRFDSIWSPLGGSGISAGQADYTCIALSGDGIPYLVYKDAANSGKATVVKWTGTAWSAIGPAGFTQGEAGYTCIAVASDGTPFTAFRDGSTGGKAAVMKYSE